jgi:virginiamycin B lyase
MPSNFDEQLERLLHRYADPVRPTRDTFAEIKERLRVKVELNGAAGHAEDDALAFTLDDTLEDTLDDTLEDPMSGNEHYRPTTTLPSPRMETPRRGLSPRATAIAAIAAALILVIIAATIFTQLAVRRTPHPAATATPTAFTKIALPGATAFQIFQWATAPDGSLYFVQGSYTPNAKIAHVALDGTTTQFSVPSIPPEPGVVGEGDVVIQTYSIAVASDGAVWLSGQYDQGEPFGEFVQRMTPDGVFTTIPIPAGFRPSFLFTGPDGGMWVSGQTGVYRGVTPTGRYAGIIGKLAPSGLVTAHPFQASPSTVTGLSVGPDQAIWQAMVDPLGPELTHFAGRIVRVSPTGQAQEFAAPHPPNSITTGSDGALWFSEYSQITSEGAWGLLALFTGAPQKGVIGRMTTAGAASELPIDPNIGVDQVVSGSDGAVWFTIDQDEAGKIGRITPSGKVTWFTTGGNSGITQIAAAPGALWLLDGRNTLWRYHL